MTSECLTVGSVASSGAVGFGYCWLVGDDGLLLVLFQGFLCLLGVDEFIPRLASGIKPLQEDIRFPGSLLDQCNSSIIRWLRTIRFDCLKRCIQSSSVRIKDLHHILPGIGINQLE